jgi:hypothetical protein
MSAFRRMGGPGIRRGLRAPHVASGGGDGLPTLAYDWRAGAGVADDGTGPPPGVDTWTDQVASLALTENGKPDLIAADAGFGGAEALDFGPGGVAVLRDSAPRAALAFLHSGAGMTVLADLFVETGAAGNGVLVDTNNGSLSLLGSVVRFESTGNVMRFFCGNGSANVVDISGAFARSGRRRLMIRFASVAFDSDGAGLMRVADMWVDGTQVASQAAVSNAAASGTPANVLSIGNRSGSTTQQLDGRIRRISLASSIISLDEWDAWRAVA